MILTFTACEGFFGRMKVEMFYGKEKTFKDLKDLEKAIKDYINWYNSDRVCKKLNGLSPINPKLPNA